jgi:superoxide dismutase
MHVRWSQEHQFALVCQEHAYYMDYQCQKKKNYVDNFLILSTGTKIEENYAAVIQ